MDFSEVRAFWDGLDDPISISLTRRSGPFSSAVSKLYAGVESTTFAFEFAFEFAFVVFFSGIRIRLRIRFCHLAPTFHLATKNS